MPNLDFWFVKVYAPGGAWLGNVRRRHLPKDVAELLGCRAEDVHFPDVYWGEDGGETAVDAVVVDGELVATLDEPIDLSDVEQIVANPLNNHAGFIKQQAAE